MIPPGLLLVDTSALARASDSGVRADLVRLGRLGLLATCATIDLEVGYSARTPEDHRLTAELRRTGFTDLPMSAAVGSRALAVQAALAVRSQHRSAGVVDLLTAAVAEQHAATVLHYDRDFDAIAAVTGQHARWVAPPGSLD